MTTTIEKQVLMNARALIADPAHWAWGTLASTASGQSVDPCHPSATQWCAAGALYRAAYDLVGDRDEARRIGNKVASTVYPRRWWSGSLPAFNDRRGHAAVLEVFDKALQLA
jgi:hypothetical protein